MVSSSMPMELNTSVVLTLKYKNYRYASADTNEKVIRYSIPNNINSLPGVVKISSSITYTNEGVNHNQPYIEVYQGNMPSGFLESSRVLLNSSGSTFNADTMIINFSIQPLSGPGYSMVNKYKKI